MTKMAKMSDPARRHHEDLARAAAAAMAQQYQETIEICSDLVTSGMYEDLPDAELARTLRAQARLMMATAMHYNEGHYEDIVKVLTSAMDSPPEVQKDVYFTLAVVHISFDKRDEARAAMEKCLEINAQLEARGTADAKAHQQQEDAAQFLQMLNGLTGGGTTN
jgi:tetratricopeptide (TPR) repeat protein